jgi:hypothetical protein
MSRCLTNNFQFSIMSEWLAKQISTKVTFKITTRKRNVYIDIGWPWIRNQCFSLGIWNDDRTKMILLPAFHFVIRLYSQNNETEFINKLWYIIFFMNIDISSWHNWCFDLTKMLFFALFQFLTRLLTSKHLKLFSTYLVGRNERCEIRAFQLLKLRKNKIIWNIKTK